MLKPAQPTVEVMKHENGYYYVLNVNNTKRPERGPYETDTQAHRAGNAELKLLQRHS